MKSPIKLPPARVKEINAVIDVVERHTGITRIQIKGKSRIEEVVDARHMVWFYCVKHLDLGLSQIGRHFGCHHGSVIHALKRMSYRLLLHRDRHLQRMMAEVANELGCPNAVPKARVEELIHA